MVPWPKPFYILYLVRGVIKYFDKYAADGFTFFLRIG